MTGKMAGLPSSNFWKELNFFAYKDKHEKCKEQLKFNFFDKLSICYEYLKCFAQLDQKSM